MSEVLKSVNEEAALEKLHGMGCTDGLPVIIPTQERVDRLVLASGLEADMVSVSYTHLTLPTILLV